MSLDYSQFASNCQIEIERQINHSYMARGDTEHETMLVPLFKKKWGNNSELALLIDRIIRKIFAYKRLEITELATYNMVCDVHFGMHVLRTDCYTYVLLCIGFGFSYLRK